MKIPLHIKLRRYLRSLLYNGLSIFIHKHKQDTNNYLDKNKIKKIVIIRPNYRIGNLIFLTPLINQLNTELPNTKIDLIIGMKLAGDILKELPNVENVYSIPRKLLLNPVALFKFIHNIRKTNYDLALNITPGSISSELTTLLVSAKNKASFEHKKSFIPLTHTIKQERLYTHAGSKPLELLKLFQIQLPQENIPLDIKLTQKEIQQAQKDFNFIINQIHPKPSYVISLFRNARFDKKIEDSWWENWYQELLKLDNSIAVIDILSPDIPHKLNDTMLSYQNKNLRVLGAFFHLCDLYISADTGPLHLATASKAKAIALFNQTNPLTFGTLGSDNLTVDVTKYTPKEIALLTYKQLIKK